MNHLFTLHIYRRVAQNIPIIIVIYLHRITNPPGELLNRRRNAPRAPGTDSRSVLGRSVPHGAAVHRSLSTLPRGTPGTVDRWHSVISRPAGAAAVIGAHRRDGEGVPAEVQQRHERRCHIWHSFRC